MGISAGGNVTAGRDVVSVDGDGNTVASTVSGGTARGDEQKEKEMAAQIQELRGMLDQLTQQLMNNERGAQSETAVMIQHYVGEALAAQQKGEETSPYVAGVKGLVGMVSQLRKDAAPILNGIVGLLDKITGAK